MSHTALHYMLFTYLPHLWSPCEAIVLCAWISNSSCLFLVLRMFPHGFLYYMDVLYYIGCHPLQNFILVTLTRLSDLMEVMLLSTSADGSYHFPLCSWAESKDYLAQHDGSASSCSPGYHWASLLCEDSHSAWCLLGALGSLLITTH